MRAVRRLTPTGAADWLSEGPAYAVAGVRWDRQQTEPTETLRLLRQQPSTAEGARPATARTI